MDKQHLKTQLLVAAMPLITESLAALTDAVKELRIQMAEDAAARRATRPLETQLQTLQLQNQIAAEKAAAEHRLNEHRDAMQEREERKCAKRCDCKKSDEWVAAEEE